MRTPLRALAVASLALFALACGKGAAEQALVAASAAVEQAKPDVERYLPDELKQMNDGLRAAKTSFDRGDYKRALASAQALLPRVQGALEAARKKKDEAAATFDQLKQSVPALVDALTRRLAQLAAAPTLPADLDLQTVQTAQANLGTVTAAWTDALSKFESGDVLAAVTKASDVKAKADEMASVFLPARAPRK